ncbi:probable serine/threonine-protein kinase mps1 [Bolinopsis microptera]|uniref:probable serine/threonine-protein kinase mps1 n=1 Tax=Bolinopsis microptera TaxID=2820187 RepID=UPI00307A38AB
MSEISDVSSSKHGEVSTTRIQELLNKYGSDGRKTKAEDSCVSMKLPFQMTRERQQSDPVPSLSISLNSVCSTSSNSSVLPASFTPAPNVASVRTRPPLSYSARITPRPRKINSVTKIKFFEKGVQANLMKGENDENTPPSNQAAYNALKKQAQEMEARLKKENEYLVAQVKKMQEQASLKAAFSPDGQLNDLKNKIHELEKENKYLANQVKKMQEAASLKSVFPAKEHYSGAMAPVTIAGNEFDVWKKEIGKGASCMVYKGVDRSRDVMVAIKVVSLQKLNPQSNDEMRREIELLQNLKNEDCIINLFYHEFRVERCRLSMVLEFGETDLHTYMQQTPWLVKSPCKQSYYEVCLLWQQMLRAVHCIHSHSIVHKDLKPQNFMLVKGKLKLIDFGISQMIQDEVTSMIIKQPEGTPNYIAPEMLSGTFGDAEANVLGYRSDVYSLGCILFKMCFGVTPYQHIEKMQMKYLAITSTEPINIPEKLQYQDIRQILEVCLKKDRTKRATVAQLLKM